MEFKEHIDMDIKVAISRLGYTEEWIDFGIISKDSLMAQYNEILVSEDQNAEHYRNGAFGVYLSSKDCLSDKEISCIFELRDNGPDKIDLHANRIISLIHSGLLGSAQLDSLSNYKEVLEEPISKIYERTKLLERIKNTGLESNFSAVKQTIDTTVHEFVLNLDDLKRHHVEWLAELGGNKRCRNIAKQFLNSRRFKQ